MKKGGYQIINLEGRNFSEGVGQQFDGLYELIEGTNKTVYVSGVTIDDVEYRDDYYSFRKVGTKYYLTSTEVIIEIADTDVVTACSRTFYFGAAGTVGDYIPMNENVFRLLSYGGGKIELSYSTGVGISLGFVVDTNTNTMKVFVVAENGTIHVGSYSGNSIVFN